MGATYLEIDKSDITDVRFTSDDSSLVATPGTVVLQIDRMALTSNNVSYALSGDFLDYWGFFPAADGWGRLPAMGFSTVISSAVAGIEEGSRWFGFVPVASHHTVQAQVRGDGFVDCAPHREKHAPAYKQFDPIDPSFTVEDECRHLLLRGLFVTSHLCEDFLADNAMFGAQQVLVTSASSKTSLALAHEIKAHASARTVGLTSPANVDFVVSTGLYDSVVTYADIPALEVVPSVVVDMAGSSSILRTVHERFGDNLGHSCRVGATHWTDNGSMAGMPGPEPQFFFAPAQLVKRGKEWGREVLNQRMSTALAAFAKDSVRWMTVQQSTGDDAVRGVYSSLTGGSVDPSIGHIVSLS